MPIYVPKQGDVVWMDFDPQAGYEQAGRRPALVLSATAYNKKTGLLTCCPLTNQEKGYPFEVSMESVRGVSGVALADQIKCLDWKVRKVKKKGHVSKEVLVEVIAKTNALLKVER